MADERAGTRDFDTRKSLSWLDLLRTFLIALDPFKLLIAALGILLTAIGWWLISLVWFNSWSEPKGLNDPRVRETEIKDRKDALIKEGKDEKFAESRAQTDYANDLNRYLLMRNLAGPAGAYRTMPWFENRGRNPFIVAQHAIAGGPQGRNEAINWFLTSQIAVLIEPLLKFLSPVVGLFDPNANFWVRCYLFLITLWMLVVWAFFGGVITRMAIVQMAGKEGGGLRDAVNFVKSRYLSYLFSPIVPILIIFAVVVGCMIYGLIHLIPLAGDFFDGLFWWIPLGAGFVMALLVVGLVGYPLMYTTLSAEGSDTFDALSRSYNYVYESPWSYIWYGFVAIIYGAVVVFFVVFMTSLMVYLGKWGVSQTPFTEASNRSPEYLFIYAPTSFGWQELMLQGSPAAVEPNPAYSRVFHDPVGPDAYKNDQPQFVPVNPSAAREYLDSYTWWNRVGAAMVAFWLTLLFMLMLGFSYSYFWTAASMIYLLMRKRVDEVEPDEIYTEEEEVEQPSAPPKLSTASPSGPTTIPVDAPTLRVSTPPASAAAPPASGPTPPSSPTNEGSSGGAAEAIPLPPSTSGGEKLPPPAVPDLPPTTP